VASLKEIGERALVDRIVKRIKGAAHVGPGDDAACIDINGTKIVLSSDIVSFDRHMVKGMTMEQFGWLAAAVNFSDVASMGAEPIGILAAVSLPPETDENVLYEIMDGICRCADLCGAEVLGGDTKPGPGSVCGTAVGVCGHGVLTRSGAKPGDMVAVTGSLGSAAAGWYAASNGIDGKAAVSDAVLPVPRVKEGLFLSESGIATSCMDISDGLSTTAHAICSGSGVGMDILWESLPVCKWVSRVSEELGIPEKHMILNGGGEYELMFTFDKKHLDALHSSDMDFSVIGMIMSGGIVNLITEGVPEPMENKGYEHFTQDRSQVL